jgi:Ser/Thr protein kinase RdoA (MazF antagonist)
MSGATSHRQAVDAAWAAYGDPRTIVGADEVSANVSTNRVYRLHLDDGSTVVSKVSSYGSYFLFVEDHEQLDRCATLLHSTRFTGMLADIWSRDGRTFTWYDQHMWAVFYDDVPRRDSLPRILSTDQIANLATEMAEFHLACTDIAPHLPSASKTIKSDAIHLLDLLESPFAPRNFDLAPEAIAVLWKHTHRFLERLVEVGYDEWPKIPILIDWNLGNFSVDTSADGRFRLYSRWDYDWFRIEPRLLDFYFLSRVSSSTGDRTRFTYGPHTLTEPSFLAFLDAYRSVFPMSTDEVAFLPEVYRFFILNYVVREGARFFRHDLCTQFRRDAVRSYLPALDDLDVSPLLKA